jgi:iron complex transport system substrate-binding protein
MTPSRPLALMIAVGALVAAACGSEEVAGPGTSGGAGPAAGAFPVTIENCGQRYTFDRAPSRAVTMNQHVTEVLLALGLVDRMVGTAYLDSTIRPDLATDYAKVPVLAKEYPSKEQVVAVDPDVVIGGYASAFADDAAGPRDALASLGIDSYLTAGYCPDYTGKNSIDLVRSDIGNVGRMFGLSAAADELVDEIQATIDRVTAALAGVEPVKVFVYDSGTDLAFTAGGREMTTALLELAGGTNVFADIPKNFAEVSWEDVVARDPDVIVILDYGDTTVEQKQRDLAAHPVASTLRAVQDQRYVVVDLTDVVPGIRNGDAVATLAAGLHPDRF